MSGKFSEFQWDVHKDGYHWIDTFTADPKKEEDTFLTDRNPNGASGFTIYRYMPLALYSGLFRVFAEIEPTREAIRAFADRFGLLGGSAAKSIALPEPRPKEGYYIGTGEVWSVWRKEVITMRRAVDLWEKARLADVESLAQVIRWNDKGVQYVSASELGQEVRPDQPWNDTFAWIATEFVNPELLDRFRRDDVIEPALYYVQRVVNERLKGRVSPRLLWDHDRPRLGLQMVPSSLAGALWLQFAHAIERNSDFRQCNECRIWFELSAQSGRSDKVYCSNACRSRAYRKRQANAQSLHADGLSESEIAERLNSDVEAVKGWIAKSKTTSRSRTRAQHRASSRRSTVRHSR